MRGLLERMDHPTINQTETHMHHTVLYKIDVSLLETNYAQYSTHCRLWCLATPTCRLLAALSGESLLTFTVCICNHYSIHWYYISRWLSVMPLISHSCTEFPSCFSLSLYTYKPFSSYVFRCGMWPINKSMVMNVPDWSGLECDGDLPYSVYKCQQVCCKGTLEIWLAESHDLHMMSLIASSAKFRYTRLCSRAPFITMQSLPDSSCCPRGRWL